MTRTTLFVLGLVATGAALAPGARAQGGGTLNVGGTTVVLARSGGRYQGTQLPRIPTVPQFRPLSTETRAAALRAGEEALAAAEPGRALSRLSQLPGGGTLVTARPTRPMAAATPRAPAAATFRPLSAAAKAAILQTINAGDGAAPAAAAAETPFTLGPHALNAVGRAMLYVEEPQYLAGNCGYFAFNSDKGFVQVVNASGKGGQKYLLHFQVLNPSSASFEYTILAGDGTTTKVSAKPSSMQDIVVMLTFPPNNTGLGPMAEIRGATALWYFLGVEITPM